MKSLFLGFVVAIATLAATPSYSADDRNVTVVNGTGYGIKFLGFNNPGDNDWSDNELGQPLRNGQSVYVKFNNADKGCKWNIKIVWSDEDTAVLWKDVDLCQIDELTLRYNRATDQTSFTAK